MVFRILLVFSMKILCSFLFIGFLLVGGGSRLIGMFCVGGLIGCIGVVIILVRDRVGVLLVSVLVVGGVLVLVLGNCILGRLRLERFSFFRFEFF